MTRGQGSRSEREAADEIFAQHLDATERGEPADFEALVAAHPECAGELRELERAWSAIVAELGQAALEGADAPMDTEATRYDILGELGQGGMGVVYEVFDRDLERNLAMKVLRGAAPRSSSRSRRFADEARITGRLQHPGIVPVHELGTDAAGRAYFTLAKVAGLTFHEVIDRVHGSDPDWTLARAVSHLLRACEALAFAHSRGVVHRDLKPTNVMVGPFGETYVMDWGLARDLSAVATVAHQPPPLHPRGPAQSPEVSPSIESSAGGEQPSSSAVRGPLPASQGASPAAQRTLEGEVLGTPAYMPPEQARGEMALVGPRSDVYAAGAVLYHLLAGRAPYAELGALEPLALLDRVEAGPPATLVSAAKRAPVELRAIAERAMDRDPAARYADMGELTEDLRAWLEGRAVRAHGTGLWTVLRKWVARNRRFSVAVGAVLLAVAVGVAWNVITFATGEARRGRLADLQLLRGVRVELEQLGGALPEDGPGLARWLRDAEALGARLDGHRAALAAVDGRAAAAQEARDDQGRPTFANADRAFEHQRLRDLVAELGAFVEPAGELARARERLQWIEALERTTIDSEAAAWERAAADLRADPRFAGVELEPQIGLIPLGVDPDGGLPAFLVARSGAAPTRAVDGRFEVRAETGCVLLLLPGGPATFGVDPAVDALAYGAESPRRTDDLDPYFIGKWELSQRQWELLAMGPLGAAAARGPVLPVTGVRWSEAAKHLAEHGLALPTEVQWEHAARGGSLTRFWWGDELEPIFEFERVVGPEPSPIDDGAPNPYGLVHALGNAAEWCDGDTFDYREPALDGAGHRATPAGSVTRAVRGGVGFNSWDDLRPEISERLVRVTMRSRAGIDDAKPERGLRVARALAR
ncbi:bifunctional serine/threonine-protein kinase/formylglycine-generating enzyme family protein [Engelhardtia mirabilis]|uniref:Serine/threonine-protein kinase PknD n=1 Tax=Engelhardtia mirabilis TaxID=2528011 RepID=A0A518BFI4_9BACT|nr:Serine/threonine-protein kinase PknD [Planctomycetes bacterium Pla133]QDV00052.1 Serine/threonine-protein kinase PknD [Planctomycetes bacterium Pla86]